MLLVWYLDDVNWNRHALCVLFGCWECGAVRCEMAVSVYGMWILLSWLCCVPCSQHADKSIGRVCLILRIPKIVGLQLVTPSLFVCLRTPKSFLNGGDNCRELAVTQTQTQTAWATPRHHISIASNFINPQRCWLSYVLLVKAYQMIENVMQNNGRFSRRLSMQTIKTRRFVSLTLDLLG